MVFRAPHAPRGQLQAGLTGGDPYIGLQPIVLKVGPYEGGTWDSK